VERVAVRRPDEEHVTHGVIVSARISRATA
jgi:hypothetical protein